MCRVLCFDWHASSPAALLRKQVDEMEQIGISPLDVNTKTNDSFVHREQETMILQQQQQQPYEVKPQLITAVTAGEYAALNLEYSGVDPSGASAFVAKGTSAALAPAACPPNHNTTHRARLLVLLPSCI